MYKCKHFKIYELIDEQTFKSTPEWKLWFAFDDRLLQVIDILREEIGVPITINNWKWGNNRQWSGLRPHGTEWYSQWSQHSFGRAVDMLFKGKDSDDVRNEIEALVNSGRFAGIASSITCETGVSWVHLDVRSNNIGYNSFKP